jgi:Protein of unknown function (DUF 659)
VTDNTSANKKAWCILKEKYPTKFFQGCCSHGLNLLVKDIFSAIKTRQSGNPEPQFTDGYPFEYLQTFVNEVRAMVVFFGNHHLIKDTLETMQCASCLRKLSKNCPTR